MINKYAGIGSRETPPCVLILMQGFARKMAERGLELHTGGAPGADQAFMRGAAFGGGKIVLHLPWENFEKQFVDAIMRISDKVETRVMNDKKVDQDLLDLHPVGYKMEGANRLLLGRNGEIVRDSKFVCCWIQDEKKGFGGTVHALRVARYFDIPTRNLYDSWTRRKIRSFLQ